VRQCIRKSFLVLAAAEAADAKALMLEGSSDARCTAVTNTAVLLVTVFAQPPVAPKSAEVFRIFMPPPP